MVISDRARAYLTCSLLIPVNKSGGGIRPIAVSEVFYRLACIYALELVRDVLPDVFEPIQLGVGALEARSARFIYFRLALLPWA